MNLSAIEEYFDKNASADYISAKLDSVIFDFMQIYGQTDDCCLSNKECSSAVYWLKELRDLFGQIHKDNANSV